jgi:hypothetical protein
MTQYKQTRGPFPETAPIDINQFRQQHFHQWVLEDHLGYCQSSSGWAFFGFVVVREKVLCLATTASGDFYYGKPSLSLLQAAIRLHTQKWKRPEPLLATLLDLAVADPDFFRTLPHAPIPYYLKLWDDSDELNDPLPMLVAQLARPFGTADIQRLIDLNDALCSWMDRDILRFLYKEDLDARLHHYCCIQSSPDPEMRRQRLQSPLRSPIRRIDYDPLRIEF